MAAVNEEIITNNAELTRTQKLLEELNLSLESQIEARTHEARKARLEAENQRSRLERFFMQSPAAICILDGPDLIYELVNQGYQ